MLRVLRQRNFALLWGGGLLSRIGTAMLYAALPYFVYATSHSVLAPGTALISEIVPGVLLNTVGGVYADRLPRKAVMALGNGIRGAILFPLVAVHGPSTLWIVYLTGFLGSSVSAFAGPFGSAALPNLVSTEDLPTANAAFSLGDSVATLIGAPLGGLLLQHAGLSVVVVIDCVSFLIPTAAISLIDVPLEDATATPREDSPRNRLLYEWWMGSRYIYGVRWMRLLFVVAILVFFGNGVVSVVIVPFIRQVLHGSPSFYSLTLTVTAITGTIAGFLVAPINARFSPAELIASGVTLFGITDVVAAATAAPGMMFVTSAVVGMIGLVILANLSTLLQSRSPDHFRGRVYGTYTSTIALSGLCGSAAATLVADHLGIRLMFVVGGIIFMAGGLVAWSTVVPSVPEAHSPLGGPASLAPGIPVVHTWEIVRRRSREAPGKPTKGREMRIGILGAGDMGRTHAEIYAAMPGVQVAGIVGRTKARSEPLARELGVSVADDPSTLLDDASIDAIDITFPSGLHREWAVAALERGKHVFCETPMALSVADADAMIDAAKRANRILLPAQVHRFGPEYAAVRDLAIDGALGRPLAVFASARMPPYGAGTRRDLALYGGPMLDLMIHPFDMVNWILGTPIAVSGTGVVGPSGTIDQAFIAIEFEDAAGMVEGSAMMPASFPFTGSVRVVCADGALEAGMQLGAREEFSLIRYAAEGKPEELEPEGGNPYDAECRYFVACVRGDAEPGRLSADAEREAIRVALAAEQAVEAHMRLVL